MYIYPQAYTNLNMPPHLQAWCMWQLQYIADPAYHAFFALTINNAVTLVNGANVDDASRRSNDTIPHAGVAFGQPGVNTVRNILDGANYLLLFRFYDGQNTGLLPKGTSQTPKDVTSSPSTSEPLSSTTISSKTTMLSTIPVPSSIMVGGTDGGGSSSVPMSINPAMMRLRAQDKHRLTEGLGGFQPSRFNKQSIRSGAHESGFTHGSNSVSTSYSLPHLMGTYSAAVQAILYGNQIVVNLQYGQATHLGIFLVPKARTNAHNRNAFNTNVAWYEREILFQGNDLWNYRLIRTINPFAHNTQIAPQQVMTNRLFIDIPVIPNTGAPIVTVTPPH